MGFLDAFNERMTKGRIGQYFEMEQRKTTFLQELRAGVVCFLTVCYIIPVNSSILADTGGSCVPSTNCSAERYTAVGDACVFDDYGTNPEWGDCIVLMKQNLIAATCISGMISTLLMALIARMPLAIAPAMGVNAYFSYTVVGFMGTGKISYQDALAAAFVEGWLFILLSILGVRGKIMALIPHSLMMATAAGIGCFLAFIGLQKSEGLGIITFDGATLVTLGGCPPDEQAYAYVMRDIDAYWMNYCWNAWRLNITSSNLTAYSDHIAKALFIDTYGLSLPVNPSELCSSDVMSFSGPYPTPVPASVVGLPPKSSNYHCMGKQLRSATMWLGIAGGMLMVILLIRGIKASILWGILLVTFVSWIPTPGNKATYFTDSSPIAGGEARYEYFKKVVTLPSVALSGGQLNFPGLAVSDTWVALITFLYLDFMDGTSVMFSLARMVGDDLPGFINERGQWPRQLQTMCMDGISIVIGSCLGTSPLTVFAESSVGIREGGKTGMTAFVVAVGFGISMFLAPIFASIPPYATGPAIILVGALMMEHAKYVAWEEPKQAIPAFLTILFMPLTYSVAYGVITGILVTTAIWIICFFLDVFSALVFHTKTMREVWLDTNSHFYIVFNMEQILIDELPGYKSQPYGGGHGSGPDNSKDSKVGDLPDVSKSSDKSASVMIDKFSTRSDAHDVQMGHMSANITRISHRIAKPSLGYSEDGAPNAEKS